MHLCTKNLKLQLKKEEIINNIIDINELNNIHVTITTKIVDMKYFPLIAYTRTIYRLTK